MRVILVLCLTPLVALFIWQVPHRSVSDAPAPVHVQPQGMVWAQRVFTRKEPFARWLAERDASYAKWAALHDAAAQRLATRP